MAGDNLVIVRGLRDTRSVLTRWNVDPWPVLGGWVRRSAFIAAGLLLSVFLVSLYAAPGTGGVIMAGLNAPASLDAVGEVLRRNALVLALHGFACVAGFIAGSSLPAEAERYSERWARFHDRAGTFALLFVVAATTFSLVSQAWALGHAASTLAAQGNTSVVVVMTGILPHALPELVALFLPLAAFMIAARRGDWHELLAATFATCALAVPVLIVSALVEVYVSPHLMLFLRG